MTPSLRLRPMSRREEIVRFENQQFAGVRSGQPVYLALNTHGQTGAGLEPGALLSSGEVQPGVSPRATGQRRRKPPETPATTSATVEAESSEQGRPVEAAPFFESLRRRMLDQLAEIELRRDTPLVERVAEPEEQAAIQTHNERQAAVLESDRRIVRRIIAALDRLKDGSYGECLDCSEPIPAKRLEIVAYAERCVPCQTAREQRQRERREWEEEEE